MRLFYSWLLVFLFLLVGCAGVNFERPDDSSIQLGKSTYSEVIERFGTPQLSGEVVIRDHKVQRATYVFSSGGFEPAEAYVKPARALTYYFDKGVVVGSEFTSSFRKDSTNFDDGKIKYFRKGETTRAEIIANLGRPSIFYQEPLAKKSGTQSIGYLYVATRGNAYIGLRHARKFYFLEFDESDRLADSEFSISVTK